MQKGIRTPTRGRPCREYGIRTGSAEHSAPRSSARPPSPIHAQLGRRRWRTRLPQCRRKSAHQPRADPAENMGIRTGSAEHSAPTVIRKTTYPDTRPTRTMPMKNPSSSMQKGIRTPTQGRPCIEYGIPTGSAEHSAPRSSTRPSSPKLVDSSDYSHIDNHEHTNIQTKKFNERCICPPTWGKLIKLFWWWNIYWRRGAKGGHDKMLISMRPPWVYYGVGNSKSK